MRSQQNHPQSLVALNAPILERRRLSDESCFATDAKLSRVIESFDDILAPARKQIASSVQRRKVNFDSQSAARVPFERMYTKPSLPEKKDLSCANASWSYARAWSIQYHDLMKRCLKLAKPMDPACRLSICIPVAATQEDKYIGKTIAAFSRQTASRESFELVLLVNAPIQDQKKNPAAIQATLENIDYAKRRYPDLRVVVVPLLIAPDVKVTIGLLRSIVTDLALLRHIRRKNGNDHILARADADTRGVGTGYIANFLYRFDRPPDDAHPYTAAYGGEILWSPERLINDVRFYLGAQLDHAFFIARRRDYGKMRIGGPNFAVRAMYYALTGGYDDTAELGEDVNFTRKLERTVREISPEVLPLAFAGSSARLYTSARRAEAAFRTNTLVIEQWNSSATAFKLDDKSIRDTSEAILQDVEVAKPTCVEIETIVNNYFTCFAKWCKEMKVTDAIHQKFLHLVLGLDCSVDSAGQVTIQSIDRFWQKYLEFREDWHAQWERRLTCRMNE